MTRRAWTRDETLVAFNVYCRLPFGRLHARNPVIIEVAQALRRTASAVAMKCCNLAAFDRSLQERGVSGLKKASRLDGTIWQQFEEDPEGVAFEAEQAYARLLSRDLRFIEDVQWQDVRGLDTTALTKVRVNQHFFRSIVLSGYRERCAVCELPVPPLLVAAHIVPWSVDPSLRMNPRNGMCLCALHDRAFDTGLMIVAPDYTISVHSRIRAAGNIRSVEANFLQFVGELLTLPDRWHPDPDLLTRRAALIRDQKVDDGHC